MTRVTLDGNGTNAGERLYMAFELGDKSWRLGFTEGKRVRQVRVAALDRAETMKAIAQAKEKFKLGSDCAVVACYEAGWEGFWLARWLESEGVEVRVVDSSSIEVDRRARRAKTDRIDTDKLLRLLLRHEHGERKALRVVRVPSPQEEDRRQLDRERAELVKERGRHWVRIKSLLRAQGIRLERKRGFEEQLAQMRQWNGEPLGDELLERLKREWARHEMVAGQIQALEDKQERLVAQSQEVAHQQVAQLMQLKSVGYQSAWRLTMEFFSWRGFKNRREVAALAGLTPSPYTSGESSREQGISKAGNRRVRTTMIELAWLWLRHQPQSALSQWFQSRFGGGSKRQRRIGIVALARKLLVELWRYLQSGALPAGAQLKTA